MKATGKSAQGGRRAYSLLSSSMSSFFCVPFGGYAMLSCSTQGTNDQLKTQRSP